MVYSYRWACIVGEEAAFEWFAQIRDIQVTGAWDSFLSIAHTHTRFMALCPGLPGWASTKKEKPIWILLKQETVSGDGISWAICKPAPCSTQIPHQLVTTQFFTGRMPFLPPNQQRQSTEGWMLSIGSPRCWKQQHNSRDPYGENKHAQSWPVSFKILLHNSTGFLLHFLWKKAAWSPGPYIVPPVSPSQCHCR